MNYLAHLALSYHQPEIMVGNFIADELTQKEKEFKKSLFYIRKGEVGMGMRYGDKILKSFIPLSPRSPSLLSYTQ